MAERSGLVGGALRALAMPPVLTNFGIVLLTATIDFLVPSASAEGPLLAPILVPWARSSHCWSRSA